MVTVHEDGMVRFALYRPGASRVEVLGTFTGWHESPASMQDEGDGWWTLTVEIRPGDHEFQYLADGREWVSDYAASGLRLNEYGGWVSLLHVPAAVVVRSRRSSLVA